MKINWGTKIAIFYTSFVLFIIFMVVMAFSQNYDLVTEDYYAQEIAYQGRIDQQTNANNLKEKVQIAIDKQELIIKLPGEEDHTYEGTINCFRPSDETKDFDVAITDVSAQKIPLNKFIKGKYLLKITWSAHGQSYYDEQTIIIP
tara:strand:+ start:3803 stop:4237 length:435 start_codon:yes stop_codon:yes gene_type:complete